VVGRGPAHVLAACPDVHKWALAGALRRLEATRKPRTYWVQLTSRTNTWMREIHALV
jgi:hypothetical protein